MNKNSNLKTFKWFIVSLAVVLLIQHLALYLFIGHSIYRVFSKKYDNLYYYKAIAVGGDDLGASLIYGSKRHTISAITGFKSYLKNRWHIYQEKAIDMLFDRGHCYKEAVDENLIKKDLDGI